MYTVDINLICMYVNTDLKYIPLDTNLVRILLDCRLYHILLL